MALLKTLTEKYGNFTKGYFISYYFKLHHELFDYVSNSLLGFKNGREPITRIWIDLSSRLLRDAINVDFIIRVLDSRETEISGHSSLDRLGKGLSRTLNIPYRGNSLFKTRITQPLKGLHKTERYEEIHMVYRYRNNNPTANNILLIDDIITSGTTIREIKRAISNEIGDFNLFLFVLGKTYDSWTDENQNNDDVYQALNDIKRKLLTY